MYAYDRALLSRILSFDIDGRPVEQPFEQRLARECNWSPALAKRVVEEYRRFVYLAMTAGHPVSPSDEVDQAWHLHLTYTESYWTRLCGSVLPRPLHHNPSAGCAAEDAKFADWYDRTLKSYRAAFDREPPADIWPAGPARFDPRRKFRRIRSVDHWLIPRRATIRAVQVAGVMAGASLLVGASASAGGLALTIALIGGAVLLIGVIALVVSAILKAAGRGSGSSHASRDGGGCGATWHDMARGLRWWGRR
jgi:hypothetical protein